MVLKALKKMQIAIKLFLILTFLTGFIYPLVITGIAQLLFPWQANGSLMSYKGRLVGSQLIGQASSDPTYFWSRPSATVDYPYNATHSAGSNLGPSNPNLFALVTQRIENLRKSDPTNHNSIPIDLVTASASGLDPDISPLSAFYQAKRIANARGFTEQKIRMIIQQAIKNRTFNILGEPRVNVLELNMTLDSLSGV